jgi:predicted Zn-dependent protease
MASMVAMGLALLAARSNPQAAGAAITGAQAGAISAQLAYSRDFERESDRIGFDMLRRAGFDPRGMAAFFTRLQQNSRLYENTATAYLRTHPLTGERLSDMQNREQATTYRQVPDSIDFLLIRARVRALEGRPADAVAEFEAQLRERKFTSEAAARYGLAVAHARAGNWAAAERELSAVRRMNVSSPIVYRLQAEVRLARGDREGGMALLREANARFPMNTALAADYGRALLAQRRFADALNYADEQLIGYPQDLRFHQIRADAYAGLSRRSQYHLALAEMSLLKDQTSGAIEQLELAQKAGDANFYELSVIDGRVREARRRQLEEMKERRN